MKQLISVVIPMYNASKTIDRCLGSIINQSYKDLEIIIVNDGSTDDSREKILNYQKTDKRIKLYDEENFGVSHARNEGLKHVTGDFIQFVDSDDDLDLDYFNIMLSLINENNADMAICNNVHPFFVTYLTDRVYDMTKHDDFLEFYQHTYAPTLPWNKLIRTSAVKDIYFAENIKFAEDELYFCAIAKNIKKIVSTSKVLYHYFFAKSDEEANTSAIQTLLSNSKFWEHKTSFYYQGLLCIPTRLTYFEEAVSKKLIPFDTVNEILYCRVFDYAFFQYAAYAGFKIPEDALYQEWMNIFKDAFFYQSVKVQERYGLKFVDLLSKDISDRVREFNHYLYTAYQDIYDNKIDLKATFVAFSIFAKLFILEDNDINNANFLNRIYKELLENSTPEAKYTNELFNK